MKFLNPVGPRVNTRHSYNTIEKYLNKTVRVYVCNSRCWKCKSISLP